MEQRAIDRLALFAQWAKTKGYVDNISSFESRCGLSNKYIANSRIGKGNIGTDIISRVYSEFPMLNLTWLCTGKEDMIRESIELEYIHRSVMAQIKDLQEVIHKLCDNYDDFFNAKNIL